MSSHTEIQPNDVRAAMGIHPVDKPTPPIAHALTLIDSHITGMRSDLERMEQSLGPILGPDYPVPASPTASDHQQQSELTGVLMDMVERLSAHRTRFDSILERSEL